MAGQGGVLGATDANGAEQRISAADYEFIHKSEIVLWQTARQASNSSENCRYESLETIG